MKNNILLILLVLMTSVSFAQQFSYKPINPAFGGSTFNYNWLLSSATAQNSYEEERDERVQESDLEKFGNNINSQILSQISRALLEQQAGGFDFSQPGSYVFGTLNIEIFETGEGLIINILDTSTGEQTQVIVPN